MKDLSQDEWVEQLKKDKNAIVLDVRTMDEVEDGVIENAMHLDIYKGQEFITALEKLDKTKSYYVYCRSGNRSGQACAIMDELGFKKTYNLDGGILQWSGDLVSYN